MKPALLLPLVGDDALVVLDALNAFAAAEEATGDSAGYGKTADQLADRLRALRPLVFANVDEQLKAVGLGRYYRRPQG